jgi:polysaccharide export outer membrane protein
LAKNEYMVLTLLRRIYIVTMVLLALSISSCVNTRKATYFNDVTDGTITTPIPVPESIIHKNDLLSISVTSLNPEATEIFNTPNTAGPTTGGAVTGYLVSSEGTIQFPILGTIKVEGLTKNQLRDQLTQKLVDRKLLSDPIVTIRLLNFRVTVLGEVTHPTVIPVPNEKISLLEAIGLAGDLTIYAKRENVLVIREENGQKLIKRLNLNSNELLSSPYYYLKSDDVVYVEPNKARVATAGRGNQWVPVVISTLSFAAIIVDRIISN